MRFTLFVEKPYQNNEIFNDKSPLNRDDYLYSFRMLRTEFERRGHSLETQDLAPVDQSDGVIFIDFPKTLERGKKSYLILQESEVVRPDNYDLARHHEFEKIFTWKDSLVDGKKYFKLNFCHRLLEPFNQVAFVDKRLIVCVSGNKSSRHPFELYTARKRAIRALEKQVGHEFAYYGPGWDRFYLSNTKILKLFKKLKLEWTLPQQKTLSYEGLLKEKQTGMNHFRFCLCFENARDIPGYITEKIFDCFFASVVPVYWGAPDIADHIPKDCFIDFRDFSDVPSLAKFLMNMDQSTFERYLEAARQFLKSDQARVFSGEHFAATVVGQVLGK